MTRRRCLSADELADFVRGRSTEDEEHHVSACERCGRRVALVRRIAKAGLAPIANTADEVDELMARLASAPRNEWWKLTRDPEFQRPDVVRRLLTLAIDGRLRDMHLAVEFARAATFIADGMNVEHATLRFEAWKLSSAILREAGRYTEAEDALSKGEEAARGVADSEVAQAAIALSRALFYAEPDIWRPAEATALLNRAEAVFVAKGETDRMRALRTARALLTYRAGDLSTAQEAFAGVLAATAEGDREGYLDSLSNLMWVKVELRQTGMEINRALERLVHENKALGRTPQVARAEWMMGRVNLFGAHYGQAIELLTRAMGTIGDSDASIRAGLDAIEALLLAERHHEAFALARELASAATALDQREPSRRHRLTSQVFAYLHEAAQRQALTADLVTDVARYLDRIMRQPPSPFVPPMPLVAM